MYKIQIMKKLIHSKFLKACIPIVIVLLSVVLLEISVFNLRHWTTRFNSLGSVNALEHRGYNVRPGERNIFILPWEQQNIEFSISNINHPIRTVYVRPDFSYVDEKVIYVAIRYQDENTIYTHTAQIINGYIPSYHIPIGAMGNVDNLSVTIHNRYAGLEAVYFNAPLPWRFQWVRVLLLSFTVSLILLWRKHSFSRYLVCPSHKWQKWVDAGVVTVFVVMLFFVMFFSVDFGFVPGSGNAFDWEPYKTRGYDINDRMVEALLDGRLHLELEDHPTESLLNARYPHSPIYRHMNWVDAPWDHVFFNGRIYSYFGIVPVVILFLPYYLIRDVHLSVVVATFIFSAIAAIGFYFLWKSLVKKYLKDIPYTLYLAGLIAVLFGSNLMFIVVRGYHYEVAIASGLMFSVWGLYFILRAVYYDSYETIKARFLILGGTCLALAVGCRPTMLLASLMVPVLLWPTLRSCFPLKNMPVASRINFVVNILTLAMPYAAIGAGLAWYNYARFGSILEFGISYQITAENVAVVTHTGLLSNLRRVFDGVFVYMFSTFEVQPYFPFVFATWTNIIFTGHMARTTTIGIFMLPITWFLSVGFFIRKKAYVCKVMPVLLGMFTVGVLIALLAAVRIGTLARYSVDFFWLIIIPGAMCMILAHKEALKQGDGFARVVRRAAFVAVGISCFILFGWGMVGEHNNIWRHNPVVMRFLSDLIMIF